MNTKMILAVFDFDDTITTKDTLLEFIRFAKGNFRFLYGFMLHFPLLIAYKLKLYPNWKVKQRLFSHFFKGMKLLDFDRLCERFYRSSSDLIRPEAKKAIQHHAEVGHLLVIVSASIENWVRPFARNLNISLVLSTEIEVDMSDRLTGRFSTPNCYGEEKVRRLLQLFPQRSNYYLIAYGDSFGDKELLDFADKKFYKKFE
jgi:HAD superfamily hydrolase (TIGR01490 family)